MEHAIDLNLGDGATGHGRKQHPTQRVAERMAEASLERFNDDARLARSNGLHLHDAGLQELGNGSLHCGYTLPGTRPAIRKRYASLRAGALWEAGLLTALRFGGPVSRSVWA